MGPNKSGSERRIVVFYKFWKTVNNRVILEKMQDPNADTEWNDVLRAKGILPPREEKEISEEQLIGMVEQSIQEKSQGKGYDDMNLDELNELEDDIDEEEERIFEQFRRQR